MNELFLHYIFENNLLENKEFIILSTGIKNNDAGPDFFNAKIKIEDTIWAGNVEIHIKSSDWNRHQHQNDPAYDNTILHLVKEHDTEIYNSQKRLIPTYEMQFNPEIYQNYTHLLSSKQWIHCQEQLPFIANIFKNSWIENLSIERLIRKGEQFSELLKYNENDRENAFYQALGRGFGGSVNSLPFELLCKNTPLKILLKHKDQRLQIEALLLGQSGLLKKIEYSKLSEEDTEYFQKLEQEYHFLARKYQLKAIRADLWKFSKIRPYNFPTLKIVLFSQLIYEQNALLSQIIEINDLETLFNIFKVKAHTFWDNRYTFAPSSKIQVKRMGQSSIQHIIINTVIPFLYTLGRNNHNEEWQYKSLNWLEHITKETNHICLKMEDLGFSNQNALQSQGLIELKKEMCEKHQCIDCRLGHKILTEIGL